MINSVKRWSELKLKSNLIKKDECEKFNKYVASLIDCDTESKWKKVDQKLVKKFSDNKLIVNYYLKNLRQNIHDYSSRFQTDKYRAFKGIRATTNQSESMNKILKQVTENKELNIDKLLITLYQVQNHFIYEFQRARMQIGQYKPNKNHPSNLNITVSDYTPIEKIYESISDEKFYKSEIKDEIPHRERSTGLMIANRLLKNNSLRWVGEYFECDSLDKSEIYKLTLVPKQTCSCRFKGTCAHLLALLIKMNIYNENDKSKISFMSLIKSKFNKKKVKGQKQFRKIDKERRDSEFLENILDSDSEDYDNNLVKSKTSPSNKNDKNEKSETIPLSPLSPSETITIPNFLIKERNDFHENFREKSRNLIKNPNKIVQVKNKKTRSYQNVQSYPWSDTVIDNKPFLNDLGSLKPGRWLYSSTIDLVVEAMIYEMSLEEVVGYLSIYALDNITFNNLSNIYQKSYIGNLFNKNIIFVTIMSNNINYTPKDHFFLAVISMKTNQIIILDSMVSGKKLENYSMSFHALINLVKLIYSTNEYAQFKLNEWKFILSMDCAIQEDGISCGVFVLANISRILNKFQMHKLDNPDQARYYFRNLADRNQNVLFASYEEPKIYPEFQYIEMNDKIDINVLETSDINGMLLILSLSNFHDKNCAFNNCQGKNEKKILCSIDRFFYCISHDFFEKTNNPYFKICKNCYYLKFVKEKLETPIK